MPKGTSLSYSCYVYLMIRKADVMDDKFVKYHDIPLSHTLKQTLPAGVEYVTFTSDDFSNDSILDFYTSNGAQYSKAEFDGTRNVKVYFPPQDETIEVIVRW